MMRRGLAVLLCLCIALLPAIANARAGTKPPGYFKPLLPPFPAAKLPNATAIPPKFDLTVNPKKTPTASVHTATSGSSVSPDQLPEGWTIIGGIKSISTVPDKMVITQDASQAIIDWQSFNVGSKAIVDFSQKNSNWICLNRIFDQNPTLIFGKIQASGEILLINQNGILFERGSQIDLHTLIASSLNISNSDFMAGTLNFQAGDYQKTGLDTYLDASVINRGTITTDELGSVFLLAPHVENDGTISTTAGQIGLAAGDAVDIYQNIAVRNWDIVNVVTQASGNAANDGYAVNKGVMTANTGLIGMYGTNVVQNGTATAVTALEVNGEIELVASNSVTTGADSITSTPISDSTETADLSLNYIAGKISIIGLDPEHPTDPTTAPQKVVIDGLIQAPSGTVVIQAQDSVTLASGASIDVSGIWMDKPASANTTQVQLNSVELADYPDQKDGILHGATITVNNLLGSSIGNISGYFATQQETAQERSLTGGTISISTPYSGDVTVNQGASINFSGGGTHYSAGNVTTTALIYNNQVYSINDAPETLKYTGITTVTNYVGSYVEGANAGSLSLSAGKIVLDGGIHGAATVGVYQTRTLELLDKMGNENTLGLQAPTGGTLIIGSQPTGGVVSSQDFIVDSVVLYGPNDVLPSNSDTTYLSAQKLSQAGLSSLQVAANTSITIAADADVSLSPGGSLSFVARAIDVEGTVRVPSGSINLTDEDNVTAFAEISGNPNSRYEKIDFSGIRLEDGSEIDASGQRIDNSLAATGTGGTAPFDYIGGGYITIQDESYFSQGVKCEAGSVIDVSGGYGINLKGVVTGGDAGYLSIEGTGTIPNGAGIVLDGALKGYSMEGSNVESPILTALNLQPGSIFLHAQGILVVNPSSEINSDQYKDIGLILDEDRLNDTGFTRVYLESVDNITIEPGASLSPSLVKLAFPVPGANNNGDSLITVSSDLIGTSSFSFTAGVPIWTVDQNGEPVIPNAAASISISAGSRVNVAESGSITLKAPYISIDGDLTASAGTISATAASDLELSGTLSATGYNLPSEEPVAPGLPVSYTALSGGAVQLSASILTLAPGSEINVSGSNPVTTYILNSDGLPVSETVAGNPGSVTITGNTLSLQGKILGQAELAGLQGGTLSISSQNATNPYTLTASDIQGYVNNGFDALSFSSWNGLVFSGDMSISVGRSLTLDAPSFTGSGNVYLWAPSIQLQDSYSNGYAQAGAPQFSSLRLYNPAGAFRASSVDSNLTLAGDWITASGYFTLSGFQTAKLSAVHDIILSDEFYNTTWQGGMLTSGDLILQADRIYPSTLSSFTITASGNVTIEGSDSHNSSPVYSAGGSLTIDARNIDMEGGELAAPMGSITLAADSTSGRVYIGSGSTITTAGSISVDYGSLVYGSENSALFWDITTTTNGSTLVTAAPQGSVTITGNEVITRAGSTIDISGGGSVFAYQFQSSSSGSVDPFSGRYVIVPDADYSLPGEAVYLEGCAGLKAGVYSILPEQYAYLPGAMVVTNMGTIVTPGTSRVSADGFPVVSGYLTYLGTSIKPSVMEAFEVQPASYLFNNEGYFYTSQFVSGNAGNVKLTGNTTIVEGKILAEALSGYQGGTITLSGANAYIENSTSELLPSDFSFDTTIDQSLSGTLHVSSGALSGKGFYEIEIGNLDSSAGAITDTVTMEQGSVLQATQVVLSAQNAITLDSGARIITVDSSGDGNGRASFITPSGLLTMQQGSVVHASDQVTMVIDQLDYQAGAKGLDIDHGALNVTGQNVYFMPRGASQQADLSGLYLTSAFWSNFTNFDAVNISASGSSSDGSVQGTVAFLGGMSLAAKDSLTINAAVIEGLHTANSSDVVIEAQTISLLNRGGGSPSSPTLTDAGSLTLNADQIYVGEGAFLNALPPGNPKSNGLLIDGFSSINLVAKDEIVFQGAGSLSTGADNLNFSTERVTTSYYEDTNTQYTAPDFTISAANTNVSIKPTSGGAAVAGTTVVPGGYFEIDANSIDVDGGIIQMASGTLKLNGTSGVTLENGAELLDTGCVQQPLKGEYVYNPGGSVYLSSISGRVSVESGAVVNVSGVSEYNSTDLNDIGVNAGLISIYSPSHAFDLHGATLLGEAGNFYSSDGKKILATGIGASFTLDTANLSGILTTDRTGFSALYEMLKSGGFNDVLDIRSRNDSLLTVDAGDEVTARQFTLTADVGAIDVKGSIEVSEPDGDSFVGLYSGGDLVLYSGSSISATGSQSSARGGEILLSSTKGTVDFQQGANLDVSGGAAGKGGSIYFRASLTNDLSAVNMKLAGTITDAAQILAEGVLYGNASGVQAQQYTFTSDTTITSDDISNWQTGVQNFMNGQGSAIQAGLFKSLKLKNSETAKFVPGLEIDCSKDLTLGSTWDFSSWSVPVGMLTLRAAGNLTISQNLVDNREDAYNDYYSATAKPTWGMTLVAGADFTSSNPVAVVKQTGQFTSGIDDLTITGGTLVYTEKASLLLSAGGDIIINSPDSYGNYTAAPMPGYMIADAYPNSTMFYNVATYSGHISVSADHDVIIDGGAIQSAVGDIDVHAGGDLLLNTIYVSSGSATGSFTGSIRTTGELTGSDLSDIPDNISNYWHYGNGGSIWISVGGDVSSLAAVKAANPDLEGWDSYNNSGRFAQGWTASYGVSNSGEALPTEGLATMAGGDLTVYAGGSFSCQAGTFSPISYSDSVPALAANDKGNLTIFSGGDMTGRFLISDGFGELHSMGNFDVGVTNLPIEMFAATVHLTAEGAVNVGAIINPTVSRPLVIGSIDSGTSPVPWDLEYANNSTYASVSLTSVTGGVSLNGQDGYYGSFVNETDYGLEILPPKVTIMAAGDIDLLSDFTLSPYRKGNLILLAGGNIDGDLADGNRASIRMSQVSDALYGQQNDDVYGVQSTLSGLKAQELFGADPAGILHASDNTSVVVRAALDIEDLMLYLPKQARIIAGGDIMDLYYYGQNNSYTSNNGATYSSNEVTLIEAGGNIVFSTLQNAGLDTGILVGGPGTVIIEAGNSIDLGTSAGIQVQANSSDPSQPTTASTLIVASGYTKDFSNVSKDVQFFIALQSAGEKYSEDMAAGDTALAQQDIALAEAKTIDPFFAGSITAGSGDIEMTFSQIAAQSSTAGIFLFANGSLDVGKTTVGNTSQSTNTGIYTSQGGNINVFAKWDINVNESRIMTFYGGDITVWSDTGDINAGKGSKTEVSASAPSAKCVSYGADGTCVEYVLQFSPPAVGSGIRTVTYAPGYGEQAPAEGNIYLFAPQGVIDAGEAGISGRNVILGAVQVLNANNISFSGSSVGVPVASQSVSGLSALSGVGSVTQSMQVQEAAAMNAASNKLAQALSSTSDVFASASLEIRVLSMFEADPSDSGWEKTDN
jgi:filamentous hemagglutinin family protein